MTDDRQYNKHQFKQEDIARLKQLINEGGQVMGEIDDLKAGLSETVKAIAEELDVKAAQLNKAIRIAYKASMEEEREKLDEIEDILEAAGRFSSAAPVSNADGSSGS
jgi:chaperonin cofactor prefoldin